MKREHRLRLQKKKKTLVSPPFNCLFHPEFPAHHKPLLYHPSNPPPLPFPSKKGISKMAHLDSVLPLGKVGLLLLRLQSLPCRLVLGQPSPDGTGSLDAEIKRQVLLALVEDA